MVMVRNAISSLSRLEEMHIPNGIRFLDDANDVALILDEISKLTFLRSLNIFFRHLERCQGTTVFSKLEKYDISVSAPVRSKRQALPVSTRMIELISVKVKRYKGLQSLVERAEEVRLSYTDVDGSSIWNSNREAFTDLRILEITSCDSVEYIASFSQDEIRLGRQLQASFSKLTILKIKYCSAMKYLFCKSVGICLAQLQELEVVSCGKMEAIVMNEGTSDGDITNLSKLRRLELESLSSLRSFLYRKNKEKQRGSPDNSVISCAQFPPLFDEMVYQLYLI